MKFNSEEIAKKLAGAVRIQTISKINRSQEDKEQFYKLHKYLEDTFPLVHKHLVREIIDETNLIYHWKGKKGYDGNPLALLAHQDVVAPGKTEDWIYPPFDGKPQWGQTPLKF